MDNRVKKAINHKLAIWIYYTLVYANGERHLHIITYKLSEKIKLYIINKYMGNRAD